MGERRFSKTKRLSICCLIENKGFAIMLLRIWLYFLLSARFSILGIDTLSAKSLAALPAY